jgi:hypothetical protein
MFQPSQRRSRKPLLGALALLVILAAMLPLGAFLAGVFSGGGRRPDPSHSQQSDQTPGTLRVTVTSAIDRSPIAGARILVQGLTGGERDATSDGEGRAVLDVVANGPVRVEAVCDEGVVSVWTDPRIEREIQLAVDPASGRRGHVRFADGTPAAAQVRLLGESGEELAVTTTDEQGAYELPDDRAAFSVCAQPEGGAASVGRGGDLLVTGGEPVDGRLVGATEGTLRVFGRLAAAGDDELLFFRSNWTIDSDGVFSGRLPKGTRAWGLYDGLPVEIGPGERTLPDTVRAEGRVLRQDGGPAAGAVLLFRPLLDGDFPVPLPGLRVEADGEGHFDTPGLAKGRYSVEVRARACATTVFPEARPGEGSLEFRLARGYAVGGFVADTSGLPVSGARVQAVGVPDPAGEHPVARALADNEGRFTLEGLGGEQARIRVTAPGHHPTTLDAVRATDALTVVLQKR